MSNADTLVISKYNLRPSYFPVVAYQNGKMVLAVKVYPDLEKVIFQVGIGSEKQDIKCFQFKEIDESFQIELAHFMDGKFKIPPDILYTLLAASAKADEAKRRRSFIAISAYILEIFQ